MTAVLVVAALLLVGAGATKVAAPDNTARALAVPPVAIRAGAAAELALGVSVLATSNATLAWAVAASYTGFAVWVALALVRGAPLSTCGCFGEPDTPPTLVHVVLDLGLAAGSGAAAAEGPRAVGVGVLVVGAVAAYVAFLLMSVLPRTLAATRR